MARDEISLQYMTYDATDSVGSADITKQTVTQANGIKLNNALACKDNSVKIIVENTATSDCTLTLKAGEKQNGILGDSVIALKQSAVTVTAPLIDMARYENKDGSINIDFSESFTGTIFAVAEKAGLGS